MKQLKTCATLLLLTVLIACGNRDRSILSMLDYYGEDKEDITNVLENAYLNLANGTLCSGTIVIPFYNQDANIITEFAFYPMVSSLHNMSMTVENINISDFSENTAHVEYDLHFVIKDEDGVQHKEMIVKKIGGSWRLDAQKFLLETEEKEED